MFRRPARKWLLVAWLASTTAGAVGSPQVESPSTDRDFFAALVAVQTRALPDARSAATLGEPRIGTGVVIGDRGLTLTIGYLIIEADDEKIIDEGGHIPTPMDR